MQIVETNIEGLSKLLGKEYDKYDKRIKLLEDNIRTIGIVIQSVKKQKGISPYINFCCNQILQCIKECEL